MVLETIFWSFSSSLNLTDNSNSNFDSCVELNVMHKISHSQYLNVQRPEKTTTYFSVFFLGFEFDLDVGRFEKGRGVDFGRAYEY